MEVEDGACGEVDVVIGREQGDQANHDAGEHLDPGPGDRDSSGVEAGPRCPPSLAQIREQDWLREGNRPAPRPGGIKQTE
jgi:hypothetical protein